MVNSVILNGTWTVQHKIGEGAFGQVYQVINNKTKKKYAAKREAINSFRLQKEVELLDLLKDYDFVPKCYWRGQHDEYRVCVMDLLGPSLKQVIEVFRTIPLPIVRYLAIQMVNIMEGVHRQGIVYRDVKPDNFLLEYDFKLPEFDQEQPPDIQLLYQNQHTVSIVDFGSSDSYRDPKTGRHITYQKDRYKTGTHSFVSLKVHDGLSHTRRDDLESLGYLFVYLIRGKLPWTGIKGRNAQEVWDAVSEMKADFPLERLCAELPKGYFDFIKYTRSLYFSQDPDYDYLRKLLEDTLPESEMNSPQISNFGNSTRVHVDPNSCQVVGQNQRQHQRQDSEANRTIAHFSQNALSQRQSFELNNEVYTKLDGRSNLIIQNSLDQLLHMKRNSNQSSPNNSNQSTRNNSYDSYKTLSPPLTNHQSAQYYNNDTSDSNHRPTYSPPQLQRNTKIKSNNTQTFYINDRAPNIKGPMSPPASRNTTPTNNQIHQQPYNDNQHNNYNSFYTKDSNRNSNFQDSNRDNKSWCLRESRYTQMGRNSLRSDNNRSGNVRVYYNKDISLNQEKNSYRQENQKDVSSGYIYSSQIRDNGFDVSRGSSPNQYSQEKPRRNGYEIEKSSKSIFKTNNDCAPHQGSILEQESRQYLCTSTYDKFSQTTPAFISEDPPLITVEKVEQLLEEKRNLVLTIKRLETQHKNLESELDGLVIRKQQTENDRRQLRAQIDSISMENKNEQHLRQKSQKRNINLGMNAHDLKLTLERLQIQFEEAQEENKNINTKCRVCSVETITHAILPCYHFVMCEKCAQAAKKCCVCEKQKEGIARFYYG
ncbi:1284_t:CDS:2 [Ambispora leptoticha]|uniref:non-specific serine/threonine protein kinase n=1 Tax=Ambispora leptoticha TaxID=144679 RepID=A0A9N8ZLU0_9GLOM|nr:1284_t:CDS:2 [Ambispora leptoticha]